MRAKVLLGCVVFLCGVVGATTSYAAEEEYNDGICCKKKIETYHLLENGFNIKEGVKVWNLKYKGQNDQYVLKIIFLLDEGIIKYDDNSLSFNQIKYNTFNGYVKSQIKKEIVEAGNRIPPIFLHQNKENKCLKLLQSSKSIEEIFKEIVEKIATDPVVLQYKK